MFVWICSSHIYSLQILQSCCPTSSLIYINVKANLPFRMALQFCKLQRVSFNISKVWMFWAPNDFCCLIPLATIGHKATKTSSSTLTSSSSTARVLICQRFGPNSVTGLAQQTGHTNIYQFIEVFTDRFFIRFSLSCFGPGFMTSTRMNSHGQGVTCLDLDPMHFGRQRWRNNAALPVILGQKPGSQFSQLFQIACVVVRLISYKKFPISPWCDYNHPPICSIYRVNALFFGCFQK